MRLLFALLPALGAAVFAAASWAMAALSMARRAALRETLQGGGRRALDRYQRVGRVVEARWLVLRAFGVALSALLVDREMPTQLGQWQVLVAALVSLLAYAAPSELARVWVVRNAERAGPWLLRVLGPLELLAAPIADPIHRLGRLFEGEFPTPPPPTPGLTETEVELIVNAGEQNGSLGHDESQMIRNVLDFAGVTARNLMVPRTRVNCFELGTPLGDVLNEVAQSEQSRYPVYRDTIDNIVGVLQTRDLLAVVSRNELSSKNLEQLVETSLLFVTETQAAVSVLKEMRVRAQQLAIVIDEFGGFSGVLRLEDLVQKIVGHINTEPGIILELGSGRYLVDGRVSIPELSRALHADLPESGQYHTVAGYIVAELGRVPEAGTRLSAPGIEFLVRESDARRITKVEVHLHPDVPRRILHRPSSRPSAV